MTAIIRDVPFSLRLGSTRKDFSRTPETLLKGAEESITTGAMARQGKSFEEAVWRFAKATNPGAKVLFDHKVPDRDTRRPRQCDVWVETTIGGWPATIYISCKDYKRKLDSSHVDTFIQETQVRGASMGVLYSRSSFTAGAIEKANVNGVCCCRLYENQQADVPPVLGLPSYVCQLRIWMCAGAKNLAEIDPSLTWNDIFDRKLANSTETLAQRLEVEFQGAQFATVARMQAAHAPPEDFVIELEIPETNGRLKVRVQGEWRFFKGRVEAHLIDGSYCFNTGQFVGTQILPIVEVKDANPGPGWEPIARSDGFPEQWIIIVKAGAPFEENVRRGFGSRRVHES